MNRRGNGFGSLINKGEGKPWLARWVYKGQVYYKSTGEVDRRKALKQLERITRPFRDAREEDAIRNLQNRLIELQANRSRNDLPIEKLWDEFNKTLVKDDINEKTRNNYEKNIKGLIDWMEPRIKYASDLTVKLAEEYLDYLASTIGEKTYNIRLVLFKRMWKNLSEEFKLVNDVWSRFKKKKTSKMSARRALTAEEIALLLSKATTHDMKLLITISTYTGLRLGDCAMMKWDNIDMEKKIINVVPIKTKKHMSSPIQIPIHPTLMKMLEITPHDGSEYLSKANADGYQDGNLENRAKKLFKRCGFKTSMVVDGKVKLVCGFHSLRHTFISMAINQGMSPLLVQKIVGHSAIDMTNYYFHENMDKMAEGINAIPDVV